MTDRAEEYEGLTIDEALQAEQDAEKTPDVLIDARPSEMDEVREELGIGENVDPLQALLQAPTVAPTQDVFIRRLGATFTVQAILDDKEYDAIVERCSFYVKNRRGGGRSREVDGRRLGRLTVATYVTNPAFHPKHDREQFDQLAERFGTREPEDIVNKSLLMGEVDLLADAIMTLSGFDDEVTTAGN